jgi:hypothetical protein
MTAMRLRSPFGCGSVSYLGENLIIGSDGTIDADDEAAGVLAAHGFVVMPEQAAVELTEDEGFGAIEKLNRSGLFSILRAKGVSVSLPITNEALREAVRKAVSR